MTNISRLARKTFFGNFDYEGKTGIHVTTKAKDHQNSKPK